MGTLHVSFSLPISLGRAQREAIFEWSSNTQFIYWLIVKCVQVSAIALKRILFKSSRILIFKQLLKREG